MSDEYLEIKKGVLTAYAKTNLYSNKLSWDYFTIDGNDKHIFCLYKTSNIPKELVNRSKGRELISVCDYVFTHLKGKADTDLDSFIHENLHDTNFYYGDYPYSFIIMNYYKFGHLPKLTFYKRLNEQNYTNNFWDGIFAVTLNPGNGKICYVNYNIHTNSLISCKYGNEELSEMDAFYKDSKYLRLAYEQNKKGISPNIYNELSKINVFLAGKGSVTVELTNGDRHKYTSEPELRNMLIFQVEEGNLKCYLDKTSYYNPKITEMVPIKNLKAFLYGRKRLEINTNYLNMSRPLKLSPSVKTAAN